MGDEIQALLVIEVSSECSAYMCEGWECGGTLREWKDDWRDSHSGLIPRSHKCSSVS